MMQAEHDALPKGANVSGIIYVLYYMLYIIYCVVLSIIVSVFDAKPPSCF